MSYNVDNFSQHIGRENQIITKTLFIGGDTARFALFMAGVKGKTTVPHISGEATLQAGFCKTPSGDTTVEEVTIEVKPFTVFEEFCQDELQDKFPNMILAAGSSNADAPDGWEAAIIEIKTKSIQKALEMLYWRGDTAGANYTLYDGYIKLIDATGEAVDGNSANLTEITIDNVIDAVEGMFDAAPVDVQEDDNFAICVGNDIFNLYIKAQKKANQYHYSAEHDNGVYTIGGSGAKLQRVRGLNGTNRMFASAGRNFIIGADVQDEENVMKAWYDETDDKVYIRTKGKSGVTIANPDEIVEFSLVV